MNLVMQPHSRPELKSGSQIARVMTEAWGQANLFCAACSSERVQSSKANTKAIDFSCSECGEPYQLKSGKKWSDHRVPDAGYDAMIAAIASDRAPSLLVLQYSSEWTVRNLLLVPSFFFTATAIEKRKPLAATARRAGWVGCNILLSAIASDGKCRLVRDGVPASPAFVRNWYEKVKPLSELSVSSRGWTLEVLRVVRGLNREEFTLADVYAYTTQLSAIYPSNRNVHAKIRQQLQVLRDLGLIVFNGSGRYGVTSAGTE